MPETPSAPKPTAAPDPVLGEWRSLHIWQIQPVRDILLLAAIFGIIYLGYLLSIVTVPILLALALAYLVEPIVRLLTRHGRGPLTRPLAAATIIFITVLVVAVPLTLGVGYGVLQGATVARTIANDAQVVIDSAESPEDEAKSNRVKALGPRWEKLRDGITHVKQEAERAKSAGNGKADARSVDETTDVVAAQIYSALEWVTEWAKNNASALSKQALTTGSGVVAAAVGLLGSIGYIVFSAFLTGFFFFFFCSSYGKVLAFWKSFIPERQREPVFELVRAMDLVIAGFIRGRLTICAITITYFTIAYSIIGVPAPLVLGPVVGLLSLAPYAATLGMFIVMLLLFLDPTSSGLTASWYWIIFAPIATHALQQTMDDYFLTPTIQGKTTDMDTPTILFASLAGGILAGFYGLLLAIPVAACIKIVLRRIVWPRLQAWAKGEAKDPLPLQ